MNITSTSSKSIVIVLFILSLLLLALIYFFTKIKRKKYEMLEKYKLCRLCIFKHQNPNQKISEKDLETQYFLSSKNKRNNYISNEYFEFVEHLKKINYLGNRIQNLYSEKNTNNISELDKLEFELEELYQKINTLYFASFQQFKSITRYNKWARLEEKNINSNIDKYQVKQINKEKEIQKREKYEPNYRQNELIKTLNKLITKQIEVEKYKNSDWFKGKDDWDKQDYIDIFNQLDEFQASIQPKTWNE
uniref:Transmembrane protein n=1 Tax=Mycoplasma anserisalpingitidis TaxID=519450 RepID=A0A8F2DEV8_9MOLU|nr:hypothetical protein [Mycoplasma anserisalpingitidis]